MFDFLSEPSAYVTLLTLTALEIVLGIDNIVFISILTAKLPADRQAAARRLGLALALGMRIGLLFTLSWAIGLTEPLFSFSRWDFSGRDLILLIGGLFLVGKATHEIYQRLEAGHEDGKAGAATASFALIIAQILLLDVVFSLDSVITAVGIAEHVEIMIAAMVIAVGVMLVSAGTVSSFVNRHPSMKVLALSFLLLIGVILVADGLGQHIDKGYVYFAMAFALAVELLNLRLRKRQDPVVLHGPLQQAAAESVQRIN